MSPFCRVQIKYINVSQTKQLLLFFLLGKYLNVVRECGCDVTCPEAKEVIYTLKERAYVEQIEKAYNYASKILLDFLMEEKELVAHLRFDLFPKCLLVFVFQ